MNLFRLDSVATQQGLIDYANAVAEVSAYAHGMNNTDLPVLQQPFTDYANYITRLSDARSHSLLWQDSVLVNFDQVPQSLLNLNNIVHSAIASLLTLLERLRSSPGDPDVTKQIHAALTALKSDLQGSDAALLDLEEAVSDFASTIKDDGDNLQQLAAAATKAAAGDAAAIKKLKTIISEVRDEISTMNERMTLEKFGQWDLRILLVGLAAAVGVITGPVGPIVIGVLGATVTVFGGIGGTVVTEEDVKRLQAEIQPISDEIGGLNTTLALLQSIADSYSALSQKGDEVTAALKVVKALWQSLEVDLQAALDNFQTVQSDWQTVTGIDQAIAALGELKQSWSEMEAFAGALAELKYDVSPTTITAPLGS